MQYPVTKRAFGLAILVLSGLQLMVVLDGTVMILALPRLQEQLGLSSAGSAWTVTAYGLPFAGLMLLGGRLGDSFGRKRMLILGVAVFTVASALCGSAQNEAWLIAARAVQGTGAAIAAPTAFALVASTYAPGPARNQAIAIFGSMVGIGSIGGLVIGGALTSVDWRWIFWINVPIGALIVLGAVRELRDTKHQRISLDVRGAVLGTLACAAIVFGATEGPEIGWDSPIILGSVIGGLVLLIAFVFAERNVENPLLPWSLFDSRDRVITFIAIFLTSGVLGATTFFVAQFLQNVLGYSPLMAGLASIPFTLGAGAGTAAASKAAQFVAPRWLLFAAALVLAAGLWFGSTIDRSVEYFPTLLAMLCVVGFCVGTAIVILPLCVLVGVDMAHIGPLSAVGQMFMNMGTPFAVGLLSPIALSKTLSLDGISGKVTDMTTAQIDALGSGYTFVLLVCAIGTAVLGVLALTLRYTPAQLAHAQHAQDEAQKS
ncbi:MFS transporter [Nocardia sp. SYP-A9097]|uniref:MFS transporter n=1 Tax=Nocardia sp. SYP-A9097 TaxID=2663237 RepID=UPI00129B1FBC|nr:MFS transporter [Nocardia sp. SYP-A9097]MRH93277.1 MFS transporter [Nocardia sp. SYP-A9097]